MLIMLMIISNYINKLNVLNFSFFYFLNKKYLYFCSHKKGNIVNKHYAGHVIKLTGLIILSQVTLLLSLFWKDLPVVKTTTI